MSKKDIVAPATALTLAPVETDIVADGKNIIVIQNDELIRYFEKEFLAKLSPELGKRISNQEIRDLFKGLAEKLGASAIHEINGVIFLIPRVQYQAELSRIPVLMEILQLHTAELGGENAR